MSISRNPTRAVRLPPSRWPRELSEAHYRVVEAEDEPASMAHLLAALPVCFGLSAVDLSALTRYEEAHQQKMPREFFLRAPAHWEQLTRLCLGRACVQADSGPDAHGTWDVTYLLDAIPKFKSLRVLELPDLELDADAGWDILAACARSSTLRELDLGHNALWQLDKVVDDANVVCALERLGLNNNVLGEFGDDSVGCDLTCHALGSVVRLYTSLTALDLSGNEFANREGLVIAAALGECPHLRELNLQGGGWDPAVDAILRAAWRGPAGGLLL
jgi:hypothetical protein